MLISLLSFPILPGLALAQPQCVPGSLVSPQGAGFVMGSWSESKLVIVIEIIDVNGVGLQTDDFGEPRLVKPNHNAEAFLDHVVARGSYLDGKGRSIVQMVASCPRMVWRSVNTGSRRR
jgi:hypothetical protein